MANCEPFFQVDHMALPSVTLLECHVTSPNIAMCHPTPHVSKNVKFRLPQNPMKFDVVAKFRETISTEVSVRHLKSRNISVFQLKLLFYLLSKIMDFLGFHSLCVRTRLTNIKVNMESLS